MGYRADYVPKGESERVAGLSAGYRIAGLVLVILVVLFAAFSRFATSADLARPSVIEGDLEIRGNLTVTGSITVNGRVTAYDFRTTAGLVRFGADDSAGTLDQTILLQRGLGSNNKQSALVQQPSGKANGALFLQVPGDSLPPGSISAQILQYGPVWPGNKRRQRFSPGTIFVQGDGQPFATISTTMSGEGDSKGLREMPVLFNNGSTEMGRLNAKGLTLSPPRPNPPQPTPQPVSNQE